MKFTDASDLRVEIGNSVDLLGFELKDPAVQFTVGIDFLAYAFAANAEQFRLQIDALDGVFGGNLTASQDMADRSGLSARLRILHHSAHMANGHDISESQAWRDNRPPVPFTRDFGELVLAKSFAPAFGFGRVYGGLSYATLIRPAQLERFAYLAGTEASIDNLLPRIGAAPSSLYLCYNLSLAGNPEYAASHNLQTGLKFGGWNEKGICLYLSYYSGVHPSGEYFDRRISTLGAGFSVDFF